MRLFQLSGGQQSVRFVPYKTEMAEEEEESL